MCKTAMKELIETNVDLLFQGVALLNQISDAAYMDVAPGPMKQRVGAQIRHVLEFYECFLDGVESAHVDYDARQRDELLERSRTVAITRMMCIAGRLRAMAGLRADSVVWTAMEDHPETTGCRFLMSSVGRELQVLCSHTIHHYALVAFTLAAHGIAVKKTFGVAPSTLRYREQKAA